MALGVFFNWIQGSARRLRACILIMALAAAPNGHTTARDAWWAAREGIHNGMLIFLRDNPEPLCVVSGCFPLLHRAREDHAVIDLLDLVADTPEQAALIRTNLGSLCTKMHDWLGISLDAWRSATEKDVYDKLHNWLAQKLNTAHPPAFDTTELEEIKALVKAEVTKNAALASKELPCLCASTSPVQALTDSVCGTVKKLALGAAKTATASKNTAAASFTDILLGLIDTRRAGALKDFTKRSNVADFTAPSMTDQETGALRDYVVCLKAAVPDFSWIRSDCRWAFTDDPADAEMIALLEALRKTALYQSVHSEDLFLYMKTLRPEHAWSLNGKDLLPVLLSRRDICNLCKQKFEAAFTTDPRAPWRLAGPIIYLSQRDAQGSGYDVADNVRPFCFGCQTDKLVRVRISDTLEPWSLVQPQPGNCVVVGTGDAQCEALKISWGDRAVEVSRSLVRIPSHSCCFPLGYDEGTARAMPISFLTATRSSPEPNSYLE